MDVSSRQFPSFHPKWITQYLKICEEWQEIKGSVRSTVLLLTPSLAGIKTAPRIFRDFPSPSKTLLIQYMFFVPLQPLMVVGSLEFLKRMGHAILLGVDWSTPLVVKEEFGKLHPIPLWNILPYLV
ncbi:hypothetical protein TNCT_347601 [Trichonephila clavata]|uniref:Uncharacterized protein n=1 Tax=Trichonephila clavata TaxID=2740835 RepID=A0A8X6LVC1_TRICU|nr:hypothetical protein TNCT_347601 [Trichonephila clavata]